MIHWSDWTQMLVAAPVVFFGKVDGWNDGKIVTNILKRIIYVGWASYTTLQNVTNMISLLLMACVRGWANAGEWDDQL